MSIKKCPECGEEYDPMYLPHSCKKIKKIQKELSKEERKEEKQWNGYLLVVVAFAVITIGCAILKVTMFYLLILLIVIYFVYALIRNRKNKKIVCNEVIIKKELNQHCMETQKEPNKEEGKEKKQLNGYLVVFIVVFLIFAGIIWLSYGTLNPCEMLKKDAKRIISELVSEEMGKISKSGSVWEQLGTTIGYGLGANLVDQTIDGLSPIQCLKGVVKLKFKGKEAIRDILE